jgi:hypothetical protein
MNVKEYKKYFVIRWNITRKIFRFLMENDYEKDD